MNEDFSCQDFLAHHGILGQRWGIRRYQNPDGSLTEEGKLRYRKENASKESDIHKIIDKSSYNDDISDKVFNVLHADKNYLKEAQDILNKNSELQKNIEEHRTNGMFKDIEPDLHIYEAASELAEDARYWSKDNDVDNCTIGALAQSGFHAVCDDGQQGMINAYSMYAYQNNLEKAVSEDYKKSTDSRNDAKENAKAIISKALAEVGAEDFHPSKTAVQPLSTFIVNRMTNNDVNSGPSWKLSDAKNVSDFSPKDKSNIDKADKYVRKINKANTESTWWYLNQVVEELGFDDKELKSLTQADWDLINKQVAGLKAVAAYSDISEDGEYLSHHGILGQKWGVRRYQNEDGSLTEEGRKRYGSSKSEGIKKHIDKKLKEKKKEKAKQQQASEEERAARQKEELKEHLRKHPKQLPKYSRQLTREDAEEIISNINFDRKLKDVRRDEIQRGMRTIDDVSKNIGTFSNLVNNGKNLWNNTADVVNALSDAGVLADNVFLPKVGVTSDMSVKRQNLFKMKPEDVLNNKDKYTTDELNAYNKRKGAEESTYGYTEQGKKEAAQNGGKKGKGNKGGNSSIDIPDEAIKLAQENKWAQLKNDYPDDVYDTIEKIFNAANS